MSICTFLGSGVGSSFSAGFASSAGFGVSSGSGFSGSSGGGGIFAPRLQAVEKCLLKHHPYAYK